MDRLERAHFLDELTGKVFLNQYEAMLELDEDCVKAAFSREPKTTEPGTDPCPSLRHAGLEPANGGSR